MFSLKTAPLWTKGLVLVSVPLVIGTISTLCLIVLFDQEISEVRKQEALSAVYRVSDLFMNAVGDCGAYAVTHDESFKERYASAQKQRKSALSLPRRVFKEPAAKEKLDRLQVFLDRAYSNLDIVMTAHDSLDRVRALKIKELTDDFADSRNAYDREAKWFKTHYKTDTQAEAQRKHIRDMLFMSIFINFVVALVLAKFFAVSIHDRISRVELNTTRYANGEPLSAPISGNDEIASLDQQFRLMVQKLNESEELRRHFVAMIGHDIRTPLTSLVLVLSSIEEGQFGLLEEAGTKRLELAMVQLQRLIRLLNDLLAMERMHSGKF